MTKPTGKPKGRPNLYTKDYGDNAAQSLPTMFKNGESLAEVCADLEMSKDSFYQLCELSPLFSDAYNKGRDLSEAWWAKLGRAGAAGKVQINSPTWVFNMKNRFKWTDRVETSGAIQIHKMELTRTVVYPDAHKES